MTKSDWWQFYERGPRPLLRWVCVLGVLWVFGGSDIAGHPLDSSRSLILLTFAASVYGLRGLEKTKGGV